MLQKNRLNPPRPAAAPRPSAAHPPGAVTAGFISPEDFDTTGILAGVDPCESRYWWVAELGAAQDASSRSDRGRCGG